MAHAGTPSNLTTHRTTSSPKTFWQAFIAAILVLALAVGLVALTSNLTHTAPAIPANHSVQIQGQPGAVDVHKVVGHKGAMIYQ